MPPQQEGIRLWNPFYYLRGSDHEEGWTAQGDWRTAEQQFWEQQMLEDVHHRREIEELHRMATKARQERQTMSGDIAYLIGAFDDLNARFPPLPQD